MHALRRLGLALLPFVLLADAGAEIRIVDSGGGGDFLAIQPAVDASTDGDLILVRSGSYAGFTIDDKRLTVARDSGAVVAIVGSIEVQNLAGSRWVSLCGLSAHGASSADPALCRPGLSISNAVGAVRVQNASFVGGRCTSATDQPGGRPGAPAVEVAHCANAAFASCQTEGGEGGGISYLWLDSFGGDGGHGIESVNSKLAIYDCVLRGGAGGDGALGSGHGGDGLHVAGGKAFASDSLFAGAPPGVAWGDDAYLPGAAGGGVEVEDRGAAVLLAPSGAAAGPGIQFLSGQGRRFTVGDVDDPAVGVRIAVHGVEGDRVFLAYGRHPAFHLSLALSGVLLLPFPALSPFPSLGTIPSSGVLYVAAPFAPLASGETYAIDLLQGFVISADDRPFLGAPMTVTRVP